MDASAESDQRSVTQGTRSSRAIAWTDHQDLSKLVMSAQA